MNSGNSGDTIQLIYKTKNTTVLLRFMLQVNAFVFSADLIELKHYRER